MAELNLGHVRGADGVGIPSGGDAGQVLRKSSAIDYDTEWLTQLASHIGTSTPGVNMQDALDAKLEKSSVVNNATTEEAGYVLDARQGPALARKTIWETLWSGTLSVGGSATVPNLNGWRLIYVRTSAPTTTILIAMHGAPLRGCSGFGESNQVILSVELGVVGDVVTLTSCKNLTHNSSTTHNAGSDGNIIGIYGLIRQ